MPQMGLVSAPRGEFGDRYPMNQTDKTSQTLLLGARGTREVVFRPEALEPFSRQTRLLTPILGPEDFQSRPDLLAQADFILATWGMPALTPEFLKLMPKLKAVFYAAGTVKAFVTPECWNRGIVVSSAAEANSVPVAEYALSAILLSLKQFWHISQSTKRTRSWHRTRQVAGAYGSKVGLISMGSIGKRVAALLRNFELEVLATDPFLPPETADAFGVRLVSLETLFQECDVVSIHAPWLPETEGMVNAPLLQSMKPNATLINTARGALVNETDLCAVLSRRPDLTAILDVTHPEPPPEDSPLFSLANVVLTPHIAGSLDAECGRMVAAMADEMRRFIQGAPLKYQVTKAMLDAIA